MRILISGSSGLVGTRLVHFLKTGGHEVFRLMRHSESDEYNVILWNPDIQQLDDDLLEDFDVIIHLGGVNLASRPWTKSRKIKIRESRVKSTELLVGAITRVKNPPRLFICASAVGIYGDRGDEVLTEASEPGTGFLSDVVKQWENACEPVISAGIRVVNLRFGIILDSGGGALRKLILPFRLGVGAIIGSGKQYMPWIAIDDVLSVIHHIFFSTHIEGPVNIVAPEVVTNANFSRILGKVIRRPVLISMPAWILKKILGEMAKDTLLVSTRVKPQKLIDSGYSFLHPKIENALRSLLGK